jgi:hypothetical protein
MASLESYLRNQYLLDKRQLDRIHDVIELVLPMFGEDVMVQTKKEKVYTWPYRRDGHVATPMPSLSDSTHCMILFALNAVLQGSDRSAPAITGSLFPARIRGPRLSISDKKDGEWLRTVTRNAMESMAAQLDKRPSAYLVRSESYGDDDPMTLTWLAEVLLRPPEGFRPKARLVNRVFKAAMGACSRDPAALLSYPSTPRQPDVMPHSFLWLRAKHLAKVASQLPGLKSSLWTTHISLGMFEDEVHRQLGYFTILDSRFDPASLVFALEGALQFDSYALTDSTIDSVFGALAKAQERNPYWRPVTPFLTTPQGMVLFPVSVEVSNSLLRINEILHGASRPEHLAQVEVLLRRYMEWLLARGERHSYWYTKKKYDVPETRYRIGWHSEHVNQRGTVHMWETSQVLLFLAHYSSLLQRKIAADGLVEAGLKLRTSIEPVPGYWDSEPLVALSKVSGGASRGAGSHYAVLGRIRRDFIESATSRSLLLYGPPGTGKTTVAEQMAVSRRCGLLTITVSDFLAGGSAEVEARAKGIFEILGEQDDVVILFDEIDQFVLDRNSARYGRQVDIFQFLTPGMLTKFQDLKDKGRSIFIMATNYYERIDSAIKRQGRFDERLLLSLPDTARRKEFLWSFLEKKVAGNDKLPTTAKARAEFEAMADTVALLSETVLFGWGDFKYLVKTCLKI